MKKNNFLVTINDLKDVSKLRELGIEKVVYPLKDFCVGIPNTFLIEEIIDEGYLYINRILDNDGIDKLKKIIKNLNNNIKGIIFDDLGVLEIIKNTNLEKILYLTHFNTNSESINLYLKYVDTVIVSTDITKEEIENISKKTNGKISIFTFGYISAMYSRRLLIDNYSDFYNIEKENPLLVKNDNNSFLVYENEYGTILYHDKIFNGYSLLNIPAKYYFIITTFLNVSDIENFLNENIDYLNCDTGFLDKPTIYKLKED